jgi:hypothetical protein
MLATTTMNKEEEQGNFSAYFYKRDTIPTPPLAAVHTYLAKAQLSIS